MWESIISWGFTEPTKSLSFLGCNLGAENSMQNGTSRRVAIKVLGTAAAVIALPRATAKTEAIPSSAAVIPEADVWLRDWQQASASHKELKGPLDLRRFRDPM